LNSQNGKEDIMQDTIGAFMVAKIIYRERLQEAERERHYQQIRNNRPKLQERFLLSLGDLLISAGMKLKAQDQSSSATPMLRH
jgi:hypothetical protein